MKLNAEWISYMKAYRLYVSESPQDTIAYEDDLEIAVVPFTGTWIENFKCSYCTKVKALITNVVSAFILSI